MMDQNNKVGGFIASLQSRNLQDAIRLLNKERYRYRITIIDNIVGISSNMTPNGLPTIDLQVITPRNFSTARGIGITAVTANAWLTENANLATVKQATWSPLNTQTLLTYQRMNDK